MLQFYAHEFAAIARDLTFFRVSLREIDGIKPLVPPDRDESMAINTIRDRCEKIGLGLAAVQCTRLLVLMQKKNPSASGEAIDQAIAEVSNRIVDELKSIFFVSLDETERNLYEPSEPLFGADVDAAFPSSVFDIQEAGRCLGLGRSTACVLHLMRSLEVPLKALAVDLGVIVGRDNWGDLLKEIEVAVLALSLKSDAERKTLYSNACTQFRFFKDAWRNEAMHSRGKYTPEEANTVLVACRSFMKALAKRLHE